MNAKEAILGKIKSQVGGTTDDVERRAAVANRLANAPKGVIPARGQLNTRGSNSGVLDLSSV